jgi:arylsulfate sulfotransferase
MSGAIRWILGDPTKSWYQYPSLRRYALTLEGLTLPPIGQHSLSMASNGDLLLFDNGRASLHHTPAGENRTYSAPRRYRINTRSMTASETWNFMMAPSIYSAYCSSIYEDGLRNYIISYSMTGDVVGLTAQGSVAFHYKYSGGCLPYNVGTIHLENMAYD